MGKARSFSSTEDEAVYLTEADNENYANSTHQNAQGIGNGVFDDQSGYGNFSQSGRDQRNAALDGSLFRGNIGFLLQSAFIDSTTNTLNLLVDQSNNPTGPTASTDRIPIISGLGNIVNLITILGAQRPGQRLVIYGIFGNIITLIHNSSGTENTILCPGNVNFTLTDTEVVELFYDTTTSQWRVVGATGNGGGGDVTFPILYPKENLTPPIDGIATINIALNTGNAKQIQFPASNIEFAITGDPSNTVGEDVYVLFIQDDIGGRTLDPIDSRINNGSLMNSFLDLASDAKTLFRLTTLDGGVTYFAILVDLSTAASGLLSTLAIDTDKDWAGRFIDNLAGLSLFANGIANSVTNVDTVSFISDSPTPTSRGTIGRADDNLATIAAGVFINIADDQTFTISDDAVPRFTTDFNLNRLDTFNLSVKIENDASNASLALFRNETATVTDELGAIFFEGRNGNDNDDFIYSSIQSTIRNATAGQEGASLELRAAQGSNIAATSLILNADNSRILRWQSDDTIDLVAPVFELLATTDAIETGITQMGKINFDATTNNGVIIQPVETFAQIIVDQEDANVATESASLRFRVRDKTSSGAGVGALKTYLEFNRVSSGIIEALKDVTLENLTTNPILTLFRNSTGADGLTLGNITFKGEDEDSNPDIIYSAITSEIEDATPGQLDSSITLNTISESIFSDVRLIVNADGSEKLRFESISPISSFRFPIFELQAIVNILPPTGATQTIGEINFEASVNDGGSEPFPIETFAKIIVEQDESDINAESASLRFRVRDQNLGNPGALQTYLQFNRFKNQQIQALRDFNITGNTFIGFSWKTPSRLATTVNIDLVTGGNLTIDGQTANDGDRILVKEQTTLSQNGIYIADSAQWFRASDLAIGSDAQGATLFVIEGTVNAGSGFEQTLTPAIVDTNDLTFVQFNGAGGGANVSLSNLVNTSVNANIIPQSGLTLGSSGNEWSSVHSNNFRLGTAGVISATSLQIFGDTGGMTFNILSGSTDNFDFQAGGVSKVTISDAGSIVASNLTLSNVLTFNDLTSFSGSNGQIYREGVDVKIFSGGVERNASDIGTGGGEFFGPWTATHNAGGQLLDNLGILTSNAANPADSGFIRMGNAQTIVWEANPVGVDVTLQVNSSNQFEFSGSLIPNGTRSLGLTGTKWQSLFVNTMEVDGAALFNNNVFLGNASTDTISATGRWVTSLIPLDDNQRDLGAVNFEWKDLHIDGTAFIDTADIGIISSSVTFTGATINFNSSNVNLGDNPPTDLVSFFSKINTDFDPVGNGTKDMGSTGNTWGTISCEQIGIDANTFISLSTVDATGIEIRGSSFNDRILVNGSGVSIFALGGLDDILLECDDDIILRVTGTGDLVQFDNDGGTGGGRIHYSQSTDNFSPLNNIASLGEAGRRWIEVFALNGVINTSFSEFKTDIKAQKDSDCMGICEQLEVIKFRWKEGSFDNMAEIKRQQAIDQVHFGYKADALKIMLPEAVTGNPGEEGIYEQAVIGVLIGSIKHLKVSLDDALNRIKVLEA